MTQRLSNTLTTVKQHIDDIDEIMSFLNIEMTFISKYRNDIICDRQK